MERGECGDWCLVFVISLKKRGDCRSVKEVSVEKSVFVEMSVSVVFLRKKESSAWKRLQWLCEKNREVFLVSFDVSLNQKIFFKSKHGRVQKFYH